MSDGDMLDIHPGRGEMLVRVESRPDVKTPFCAGVIYDMAKDEVSRTAPILKYLLGLKADQLREVGRANGWKTTIVRIGE